MFLKTLRLLLVTFFQFAWICVVACSAQSHDAGSVCVCICLVPSTSVSPWNAAQLADLVRLGNLALDGFLFVYKWSWPQTGTHSWWSVHCSMIRLRLGSEPMEAGVGLSNSILLLASFAEGLDRLLLCCLLLCAGIFGPGLALPVWAAASSTPLPWQWSLCLLSVLPCSPENTSCCEQ